MTDTIKSDILKYKVLNFFLDRKESDIVDYALPEIIHVVHRKERVTKHAINKLINEGKILISRKCGPSPMYCLVDKLPKLINK